MLLNVCFCDLLVGIEKNKYKRSCLLLSKKGIFLSEDMKDENTVQILCSALSSATHFLSNTLPWWSELGDYLHLVLYLMSPSSLFMFSPSSLSSKTCFLSIFIIAK